MADLDADLRPNSAIARQHEQIEALVDAISSRFDSSKTANRNLVSMLNSLAAHLEMHFEMEEEDGYFVNVTQRLPERADQVAQLLKQHNTMLTEIDDLVTRARQAFAQNDDTTELAKRFADFKKKLLAHERAEIKLLQEAYHRDFGGGD